MATDFGFRAYDMEQCTDPFVFISYKSEDCEQVAVYARYLHDNGINVWYDEGIKSGKAWDEYILSVIERPACKAVLLFVTSRIAQSSFIPSEIKYARDNKIPTVAVYLESGLDLEALIGKAMKVYVSQWQSVMAYIGTKESVCAEVLNAARGAMSNAQSSGQAKCDELLKNAQFFLMNYRRSGSQVDISAAQKQYLTMTEEYPTDYRGWLGLAVLECTGAVTNLTDALARLESAARYYSYVVSAGADSAASPEYTQAKSGMWYRILDLMRNELNNECYSTESYEHFLKKTEPFSHRFGHTRPDVSNQYNDIRQEAVRSIQLQENSMTVTGKKAKVITSAKETDTPHAAEAYIQSKHKLRRRRIFKAIAAAAIIALLLFFISRSPSLSFLLDIQYFSC